jgi:hypothetical protein
MAVRLFIITICARIPVRHTIPMGGFSMAGSNPYRILILFTALMITAGTTSASWIEDDIGACTLTSNQDDPISISEGRDL